MLVPPERLQITIEPQDLKDFVGQPPYPSDKIYKQNTPAGG